MTDGKALVWAPIMMWASQLAVTLLACLSIGGISAAQQLSPPGHQPAQDDSSPRDRKEETQTKEAPSTPSEGRPAADDRPWRSLFDGKQLGPWRESGFGGGGEVYVEQGELVLDFGSSLSGITFAGEFPRTNYEISLEAQRASGNDFFCGLTFPVGEQFCTFILGGWGGAVVGLSSIDGKDASQNATTQYIGLKQQHWYHVLVRVDDQRIRVLLDGKQIIDQPRAGHQFGIRPEVDRSRPLGIAAWETRARLRHLRWRPLK